MLKIDNRLLIFIKHIRIVERVKKEEEQVGQHKKPTNLIATLNLHAVQFSYLKHDEFYFGAHDICGTLSVFAQKEA